MEWSTKTIEADRPFGSWAEDLASAFVQLEPRKIAEQPFQGRSRGPTSLQSRFLVSKRQSTRFCVCVRISPEASAMCTLSISNSMALVATPSAATSRSADQEILPSSTRRSRLKLRTAGISVCFALRYRDNCSQALSQSGHG